MNLLNVFRELVRHPGRLLVQRWNWKAAVFSSTLRAAIFLFANLSAGWKAATGAMLAEFCYRAVTAGFYGAFTQAFRQAEPAWAAALAVAILLPAVSHSIELAVHLARGTPRIVTSIVASVIFTIVSTLFNWFAMRRGALIVGAEGGSLLQDLKRLPRLICAFLAAGPIAAGEGLPGLIAQAGVLPGAGTAWRRGKAGAVRKQYS
jgi:hypothetical protein